MNWAELGEATANKAASMASSQRVKVILEDETKYRELLADLASFQKVADALKSKGQHFSEAGTHLVWSIAFISYVREKKIEIATRKN